MMQDDLKQIICVTENGHVVGLINLENIVEMIKIQQALEEHHKFQNH